MMSDPNDGNFLKTTRLVMKPRRGLYIVSATVFGAPRRPEDAAQSQPAN
jgi:hypothetical protein